MPLLSLSRLPAPRSRQLWCLSLCGSHLRNAWDDAVGPIKASLTSPVT